MISREIVRATIRRQGPPRIPYRLPLPRNWEEESDGALAAEVKELWDRAPNDMATYFGYAPPRDWQPPDGLAAWGRGDNRSEGACEWGARWKGVYVTHHPVSDWSLWDEYRLPNPDAPGRLDDARELTDNAGDRYRLWFFGYSLFERMWILRGFEELLMDPYLYPTRFADLRDRVVDFSLAMIDRYLELPFDGVMVGDDLGSQRSLLMNPRTWRQHYKPGYAAMFKAIHEGGRDVWMHTDGNVSEIVPDLVEIGLDVLNPVQPSALDVKELKAEYGDRLAFFGGIDVQQTLWSGTPEDVAREIEELFSILGGPDGGYIPANTNAVVQGTPLANIKAALETLDRLCGRPA